MMKHMLGRTLGFVVAGMLTMMVLAPAQAITSTGPYYAEPSWDQKLPASTRFVILSDWNSEAVLDRETGLVWEKSPDAVSIVWFDARQKCSQKALGGRKGWRLPSLHELASLVDPANNNPSLPSGHPFVNVQNVYYWSATSETVLSNQAWAVTFLDGFIVPRVKDPNVNHHPVWCARGGGPLSEY